jgi:threonine/homoserine/homoserine lactone efflux protein
MLTLGLLFALFGVSFLSALGFFAGGIGSWLSRQPRYTKLLRWLTGGIFIGLGLRLALVERR